MTTQEKLSSSVMGTYGRFPVVLEQGKDGVCTDENGKSYIDFGSGIGTSSLGYCNETWTEAVCNQARTLQHTSNLYYTKVQADCAEAICKATGYSKLFYCNSGAESNECAIKLARKYSFDKYGKGRHNIVTLVNSFHGRTMCTLSATGQEVFHNYFFPFMEGFRYAEANNTDDLRSKIDDTVCAVMIEYVQGEGGVNVLDIDYVKKLRALCDEHDILLIFDEVQTGIGRTGKFFAHEYFGVKPDIMTLAKGLGGGLPIGVFIAGEKCCDTLGSGMHGTTFGSNPVVCAGALNVLERVSKPEFLDEVVKKGKYLTEKLLSYSPSKVVGVRGKGLMIGFQVSGNPKDYLHDAADKGLLVLTAGSDVVRLLPPLTISYDEIDKGAAILADVLK